MLKYLVLPSKPCPLCPVVGTYSLWKIWCKRFWNIVATTRQVAQNRNKKLTDLPCQLPAIGSWITSRNRPSIQCKKRMSIILTGVKLRVRHIFLLSQASSGIAVSCGRVHCSVEQLYFELLVVLTQSPVGPWRYKGKIDLFLTAGENGFPLCCLQCYFWHDAFLLQAQYLS